MAINGEEIVDEIKKAPIWPLFVICGFVVSVWLLSWLLVPLAYPEPQDRAIFGDMFGAVNTLFSGLAFACVIYALYLQKCEFELQRLELKDTRRQLKRTADANDTTASLTQQLAKIEQERHEVFLVEHRPLLKCFATEVGKGDQTHSEWQLKLEVVKGVARNIELYCEYGDLFESNESYLYVHYPHGCLLIDYWRLIGKAEQWSVSIIVGVIPKGYLVFHFFPVSGELSQPMYFYSHKEADEAASL